MTKLPADTNDVQDVLSQMVDQYRCFYVTRGDIHIHPVDLDKVVGLWLDNIPWETPTTEITILLVLRDKNLNPLTTDILRLRIRDGWITDESRRRSRTALIMSNEWKGRRFTSSMIHQLRELPIDWDRQLAIMLDTPVGSLGVFHAGGMLPAAACFRIHPIRFMRLNLDYVSA